MSRVTVWIRLLRAAMGAHFCLPQLTENADVHEWLAGFDGAILATTLATGARSLWQTDLSTRPLV